MIYPPADLALLALIMTAGSVVQGAVGFASGLLGVPLMVMSGFSIVEAATVNLISAGVQNIIGAWKLRSHLDLHELAAPVTLRLLGIPVGGCGLVVASELDPALVKQAIGALLLLIVIMLGGARIRPRDSVPRRWQFGAFFLSGMMLGFASIGGPPLVLYVNSLTWSALKSRAFLFFCSATGVPVMALLVAVRFGKEVAPAALSTAAIMPAILVGLWIGMRVGNRLDKHVFRRLTFMLLTLIAVSAIVGPMILPR